MSKIVDITTFLVLCGAVVTGVLFLGGMDKLFFNDTDFMDPDRPLTLQEQLDQVNATFRKATYGLRYDNPGHNNCMDIFTNNRLGTAGMKGSVFTIEFDRERCPSAGTNDIDLDDVDEDDIEAVLTNAATARTIVTGFTCNMETQGGGWTAIGTVRQFKDVQTRDVYTITEECIPVEKHREILLTEEDRGTMLDFGSKGGKSYGLDLLKLAMQFDGDKWYYFSDPELEQDPRDIQMLNERAKGGALQLTKDRKDTSEGSVFVLRHSNTKCVYGDHEFPNTCAKSVILRPPAGVSRLTAVSDVESLSAEDQDLADHDIRANYNIMVR